MVVRDYYNDKQALLTVTHGLWWFLYVSDKDRRWMCLLDIYGLCLLVFFFSFLSFALLESKRISLLKNAGDDAPHPPSPYLWYSLVSLCFAGVWRLQLSGARATSTSCRKRSGRSRRRRRGGGWGGRCSWEQSRDLPVSPLTQTAIQRGEATTHISSVSFHLTVSLSGIVYQLGCKPCAVYNVHYMCNNVFVYFSYFDISLHSVKVYCSSTQHNAKPCDWPAVWLCRSIIKFKS